MNSLALLLGAIGAASAPAVSAHGWIERPAARQLDACNGKGLMGAVYKSGGAGTGDKGVPLGGMPGICGDPFMDKMLERWGEDHWTRFYEWECAPQETYTEGGVLDMQFIMDAPHGGFMTCNICDGDSSKLSEECIAQYPLKTCATPPYQYCSYTFFLFLYLQLPSCPVSTQRYAVVHDVTPGTVCTQPCDRRVDAG